MTRLPKYTKRSTRNSPKQVASISVGEALQTKRRSQKAAPGVGKANRSTKVSGPRAVAQRLKMFLDIANLPAEEADNFERALSIELTIAPVSMRPRFYDKVFRLYRQTLHGRKGPLRMWADYDFYPEEFYRFRLSLRQLFFEVAERVDQPKHFGGLVWDSFRQTRDGRFDVDANAWGQFRAALRDAELARIKSCSLEGCGKHFYALRRDQTCCSRQCNSKRRVYKWRENQPRYEENRKLKSASGKGDKS